MKDIMDMILQKKNSFYFEYGIQPNIIFIGYAYYKPLSHILYYDRYISGMRVEVDKYNSDKIEVGFIK